MNRLRALAATVVAALVAVAGASLLLPGLVAELAPAALAPPPADRSDASATVLPLLAGLALVVGWFVHTRVGREATLPPMAASPVEAGSTDAMDVVGRRFRHARDWAAAGWHRPGATSKVEDVERRLREAATRVYVHETGVDPAEADHAVETGVWTDDDLAAWFLSGERGRPPGAWWLRERLQPERTYRTYVDRTAAAIDELRGDRS